MVEPHAQRVLPGVRDVARGRAVTRGDAPPLEGARLPMVQPRRQQLASKTEQLGAPLHHRPPAPARPGTQCLCALTELHLPPPRPRLRLSALHRAAVGWRGGSGAPARGPPHLVVATQRGVQAREAVEASSIHQRPSLFSHETGPPPLTKPPNQTCQHGARAFT
eukprot:scaffold7966_cov51-Phaeocystis_antarctica.AAC.1